MIRLACLLALLLMSASAANATPLGPVCGTCQGSTYELSYSGSPVATTATTETFQITYTIDTTGYSAEGTHIQSVALKVSSELVSAELVSAPGGLANWNERLGGLNANGCSGSGSGFDCVRAIAIGDSPAVPGGVYTWVFNLELAKGGLLTGVGEASIKARYVDDFGSKVGDLVSEGTSLTLVTPVPEPTTLGFLSVGLLGLALVRSRRA
jgi:hypothetical protein